MKFHTPGAVVISMTSADVSGSWAAHPVLITFDRALDDSDLPSDGEIQLIAEQEAEELNAYLSGVLPAATYRELGRRILQMHPGVDSSRLPA